MRLGVESLALSSKNISGIGIYSQNIISTLLTIENMDLSFYNPYFFNGNYPKKHLPGVKVENIFAPIFLNSEKFDKIWYDDLLKNRIEKDSLDLFHGLSSFCPYSEKVPTVVTIHDLHPFFEKNNFYTSSFEQRVSRSVRSANRIICVSEFTKSQLKELLDISDDKIDVVYEGVNPMFYPRDQKQSADVLRNKYNIDEQFVVCVSDFYPRKNHLFLLESFAAARKKGLNYKLILVGKKNDYFNKIRQFINDRGFSSFVKILGYVYSEDMPYFYSLAEALVYPSLYEGFGLPLLEAMACNCKVLNSDSSSLKEISLDHGVSFDPKDKESLISALLSINNQNFWQDKLFKARNYAGNFTWEKTTQTTLGVYRKVLGK